MLGSIEFVFSEEGRFLVIVWLFINSFKFIIIEYLLVSGSFLGFRNIIANKIEGNFCFRGV